ncbi:MAG: helicase-exonuclease AddAB subunit AddA [Clostridia bacterium]|nr:helicase-exonuclease AddAB subunit AddA [Clostridia bacterium]
MGNNWNKEQQAAINTRDTNLLVSAAAGSGKTAVLVERIIQKITDEKNPVDIDRLLVVTFTNAAAAEMRERIVAAISAKLEQNPSSELLARQMTLAAKANITTIHSFCLNTLRTNFNLAEIDPNFRLADETESNLLWLDALDEVVDEMYDDEKYAEPFYLLLENYSSVKNRDGFDEMIGQIYNFAMSLPNPKKWLYTSAEKFKCSKGEFSESEMAKNILRIAQDRVRETIFQYDDLLKKAKDDDGGDNLFLFLAQEQECFKHLLDAKSYDEAQKWAQSLEFARFPNAPKGSEPVYREYIKNARTKAKKDFDNDILKGLLLLTSEEQEKVLITQYPQMRCLSELIVRLIDRFDEKKAEKNILNFNDLEHGCYRLLTDREGKPTPLAQVMAESFDEILIDEYQDTNRLQEAIFAAIKKENNLFMVGDIKQSIYRFRNTDPTLFCEKRDSFSTEGNENGKKIILAKNYRSRAEILDGINDIFEKIMSREVGEVDYNEEEKLNPDADYPDTPHPIPSDLQLHIIEPDIDGEEESVSEDDEPPRESIELEAELAAKQISELISGGYQILTKSGYRTISYKDICILLRKTKDWANIFRLTLSKYGIPCYSESGGGFLESAEVEIMMSLLKIIDNPYQDLPLLSVLRSQMFNFTTNDLAKIRAADKKGSFYDALLKISEEESPTATQVRLFLEKLNLFRKQSKYMQLDELIWALYSQTGFYDAQGAQPNGIIRQSNLRLLVTRAQEYEKTGFRGLYSFVRFIDKYRSAGGDYDVARSVGEEQDVVRIMSIHKSKGLEFPVVILCGAGKQMNRRDLSKDILIHSELGYGPKFVDSDLRITYPTAVRSIVKKQIEKETISEEMRILYVALTRAREKLIVIGSAKDIRERARNIGTSIDDRGTIQAGRVLSAVSYLDWFLMALLMHPACRELRDSIEYDIKLTESKSPWSVTIHSSSEKTESNEADDDVKTESKTYDVKTLSELIRYEYPYKKDEILPTKVTVTELKNKSLREESLDSVYLYPRPKFLQESASKKLSGAALGTAFHTVMQRLDFTKIAPEEIKNQIEQMVKKNYLAQETTDCVDVDKIIRFLHSDMGRLITSAQKVDREVMFGINIPAKEAEPDYSGDGTIMLQGVIDCVIINDGKITILDYKTEHITSKEEVAEKYKIQLLYYARAAELIYNLPVEKCYLYLFETEEIINIDVSV